MYFKRFQVKSFSSAGKAAYVVSSLKESNAFVVDPNGQDAAIVEYLAERELTLTCVLLTTEAGQGYAKSLISSYTNGVAIDPLSTLTNAFKSGGDDIRIYAPVMSNGAVRESTGVRLKLGEGVYATASNNSTTLPSSCAWTMEEGGNGLFGMFSGGAKSSGPGCSDGLDACFGGIIGFFKDVCKVPSTLARNEEEISQAIEAYTTKMEEEKEAAAEREEAEATQRAIAELAKDDLEVGADQVGVIFPKCVFTGDVVYVGDAAPELVGASYSGRATLNYPGQIVGA